MSFTDEQQEALKAKSRYLHVRTRPNLLPLGGTARFVKVTDGEFAPSTAPGARSDQTLGARARDPKGSSPVSQDQSAARPL